MSRFFSWVQGILVGKSGVVAEVDSLNNIHVANKGKISTLNSTTTPLGISATYTGDWEEVGGMYSTVSFYINADEDSSSLGLKFEYSTDGLGVDDSDEYNYFADSDKVYSVGVNLKFFRIRFINGTTAQSTFKIQTILHNTAIKPSSHRLGDSLSDEDDAELTKSILSGFDIENQSFVNIGATTSKRLLVSTETPPAGPGETPVSRSLRGDFSTTQDDLYTIPNGEMLEIRSVSFGVESNGAGMNGALFEDPNGDLSVLNVIPGSEAIIDGNSIQNQVSQQFTGDGTKRIVMRLEQLTGGSYRTFGSWSGVLT